MYNGFQKTTLITLINVSFAPN